MRYIFLHSDRKIRYNILDIVRKGSIENARKRVDDLYLDSSYSNIYRAVFQPVSYCRRKEAAGGKEWRPDSFCLLPAFGVFKIVADLAKGRSRLRKSFENIHSLCRDKRQERGLLWVLTALSAVFKTSTPCLLK